MAHLGHTPMSAFAPLSGAYRTSPPAQDAAALLDNRMPGLFAKIRMHGGAGAADHAMGARASARSCAGAC